MGFPVHRYTSNTYLRENPSWDLEDSSWKARKVIAMLAAADCQTDSICDVGCGAGGVLAELRPVFPKAELFGFDIAHDAAAFWSQHESANIHFQVGDFFQLNQRRYDVMLLLDVIEHLQDPFAFLGRLRRYADFFVFHIPIDLSAMNVLRERPLLKARRKAGHIHYFTKGLAIALLGECGYKILDWFYTEAAFTTPKYSWNTRLASLPRRVAYCLNKDLGVRVLGGETLMVLAQDKG